MANWRYRAVVAATGEIRVGETQGASREAVVEALHAAGLIPIEAQPRAAAKDRVRSRVGSAARKALPDAIGQIAVLLGAGLPLDRALGITVEHVRDPALGAALGALRERVKTGMPLAQAMAESGGLFSPMAAALAEAGETSGQLGPALARLAETLDRSEALRQTIISALVYPAMLLLVAAGVILVMLLVVVPQFESLFADLNGRLPPATVIVLGASRFLREDGLYALLAGAALAVAAQRWLRRADVRAVLDARLLRLPMLGPLIVDIETARFARTLGALVEGGVALPSALAIAARTLANRAMARPVEGVVAGLNEGAGLAGPLAAARVLPSLAIGFLKTGEETAQLGLMLGRLADILDRDIQNATKRLIALLTPAVTVLLGVVVAGVIATLMSAILGINDLALQP